MIEKIILLLEKRGLKIIQNFETLVIFSRFTIINFG